MEKLNNWIAAIRPRTLPLALSSVLVGSSAAYQESKEFGLITFWAIITTVLLQILSNLANDYGDSKQGTDNASRIGPLRSVQSGAISAKTMLKGIIVIGILALLSGLYLIYISFWQTGNYSSFWGFLALGLFAIVAAIRYTAGKNPYGYRGLGDVYVILFFGIIGVCGTFYLHTQSWNWMVILPAISIGTFAAAVLNLNNMRDRENDAKSGKITLVVRLGIKSAMRYHIALLVVGWSCLIAYLTLSHASWEWLAVLFMPLHFSHAAKVVAHTDATTLNPELKKIALSTFGIALLLFIAVFS